MLPFKIPSLAKLSAPRVKVDPTLPTYDCDLLQKEDEIGRGSFGVVFKAKFKGCDVVFKELQGTYADETDIKRFVKEAKLMNDLKNKSPNIVEFHAISYSPLTMMMEYACFDFEPFGGTMRCSGLNTFLSFVNKFQCQGIEFFQLKIAHDITEGLTCLHSCGIVHRDLKPANILVSNQHYVNIKDEEEKERIIAGNPIVCKLTDFGESRSELIKTQTMLATKTVRLQRGTFPFMAPEQFDTSHSPCARQAELFKIDIWQLGMVFFCLLNPNLETPLMIEYQEQNNRNIDVSKMISDILCAARNAGDVSTI